MERKWEIWDKKFADSFTSGEATPLDILQKPYSKLKTNRHTRLVKKVASLIEGESILDVACGVGYLYPFTWKRIYLGIDSSEAMIGRAKGFFPNESHKFQVGDAYDLSNRNSADTVVSCGLLLHLPNSEPVIKQLWSKTKICCVIATWIGWTSKLILTKRGTDKELIQRRETFGNLLEIFKGLDGLQKVEEHWFFNPYAWYGESNFIFRLWRK